MKRAVVPAGGPARRILRCCRGVYRWSFAAEEGCWRTGKENKASFEKGDEKGSVYQLLSREMPDKTQVPDGILHGTDVFLMGLTANNGEQNLWSHMETAHGVSRFTGDMEKEAKCVLRPTLLLGFISALSIRW
jgi:hypothetical protein